MAALLRGLDCVDSVATPAVIDRLPERADSADSRPFARFATLLAVLLALIVPRTAKAHLYVNRDITATRIFQSDVFLNAGVPVTFRAYTSGDGVLHLWSLASMREVASNDDAGSVRLSRFTYTPSFTGTYRLIGRNYRTVTTAVVQMCTGTINCSEKLPIASDPAVPGNWTTLSSNAPFGGTVIDVANSATTRFDYQTAETLNGTDDTVLLGINTSEQGVGYDDDSGTRRMDRMMPLPGTQIVRVVVGAYASDGTTSLYTNDYPERDLDGDGVGHVLEYYLGTCDSDMAISPYNTPCVGREPARCIDSDRDGLDDFAEVFGIDDVDISKAQLLPKWGANPLHKDLFLEQDWVLKAKCTSTPTTDPEGCWSTVPTSNPVTQSMLQTVQDVLNEGSEYEYLNLQGGGVALHVDTGYACPTAPTLCGNWGGGGQQINNWEVPKRDAKRLGVFRYWAAFPEGGSTAVPGNIVNAGISGSNPDISKRQALTFAHELGHSFGLHHYGHNIDGPTANCKPNYKSIMSYAHGPALEKFSHGLSSGVMCDQLVPFAGSFLPFTRLG